MKGSKLKHCQEAVDLDLPLHCPDIACSILVLASQDNGKGVDERNKAVPVNRKEGDSVNPLGVAPHRRAKHIVGRLPSLALGYDVKVDGGAQEENGGLG